MTSPLRPAPLRPGWARLAALAALGLVLSAFAWAPMIRAWPKTPEEDGRYGYHQFEIAKASIVQYHELPLWNAFDCRGIPMWDHPENMTASPIVWLTAWASTTFTMILWNLLHLAAGFVGMWLLARHELRLSRAATFVAASMWAFGVGHTSQYAGEHETLISFLNAPLLFFLWRRAETSSAARIGTGVLVAWMAYDGATYPLPFTLLAVALETLTRLTSRARAKNIAAAVAVVGLVAFGLAAARILPLADQLASKKRVMEDDVDAIVSWRTIQEMYTLRSPHWRSRFAGGVQQYVFGEYIAYVGVGGVVLVLLGVATTGTESAWLLWLAATLVLLMLGHFAKWAPWTLLKGHVFPFKSMRVAARFRLVLHMVLAAYAAFAVDRFPERVRRLGASKAWTDAARVAVLGAALLVVGEQIGLGQEILAYRFNGAPAQKVTRAPSFHYGGAGLAPDFIDQPRQNRAYLGCRAAWVYNADAPVWQDDVPQVRAADDGAVVASSSRTHNTFRAVVEASRPTRILFNSAHERSWRANVGTVVDAAHLLAVDVPAGRHELYLDYWPRTLTAGFWITGLTIAALVAWGFRRRLLPARFGGGT